jgi:DNA sulfur modification protein DndB
MAQSLPAFRGNFGSTEFFVVTMKAGEFYRNMTIPKEMEGWEDLTPEERFQREVDYKRVATHIAPYLAHDDDRFIGAFIVAIHQHEDMEFESLVDAGIKFPKAMPNSLMDQFGVLYLSGSEILVPLDGQHRLAAIKFAITGKDQNSNDIKGLTANPSVGADTCTVIMIRNDPQKARKIFNKVNRYAKPTSKADNLITADDDYIAVIVREHIVGELIDSRLVNIKSNTLAAKSGLFTTLATIYEISVSYEEFMIGKKPVTTALPSSHDVSLAENNLKQFWTEFLSIQAYQSSLIDPTEDGDELRDEIRKQSLICKPIVQRALAEACIYLMADEQEDGSILSLREIVDRVDLVDWSPENSIWQDILTKGDKIITGNSAMKFAARVLAYMLGQNLGDYEIKKLREQFGKNTDGKTLPDRIFGD